MTTSLVALWTVLAFAQDPDSLLLASARLHLAAHPVEIMLDDRVVPQIRAYAFLTTDTDSERLLLLSIVPKYRQTPTIVVYHRSGSGEAERLYEGLAPGSLAPISGRYVDSHTLGIGIDMTFEGVADSATVVRVMSLARQQHMHFVRYPRFVHVDSRAEAAGFLDMTPMAPNLAAPTCGEFEFPPVDTMVVGHFRADRTSSVLVALTPRDIVTYRIHGVAADGRLAKHVWLRERPGNLQGLTLLADGTIEGVGRDGRGLAIAPPQ
jgi:hypothetical protein